MRAFLVLAALLALGVAACGAITGLGEYSAGTLDGSTGGTNGEDATGQRGQDGDGSGDELGSTDDSGDAVAPTDDAGDDAPTTGDDGLDQDGEPVDGDETPDGTSTTPDDGGGGGVHDAAPEAAPVCSTSNCGGCCSNGNCLGGQSTATCGTGGTACKGCSGSTPVCSAGACVAEPMEASAPTCTMSSCAATICIPVYQRGCCKSDGTCGCQVDIPSIGSCM
jgi:hypothetical protein